MKKTLLSILTISFIPLTVLTVGINLGKPATAVPSNQAVRNCTPKTCTPYRANYERAIAKGIIRRPSLVAGHEQALKLGDQAISQGKFDEAARRYAQALVIISEDQGSTKALAFERSLDAQVLETKGKTLRQFLPLLERILPFNANPY